MEQITELVWDDHNLAHIARHEVTAAEVEEVVFGSRTVIVESERRTHRIEVHGETAERRRIVAYLDVSAARAAYCVTARPMTAKEERNYEEAEEDDH